MTADHETPRFRISLVLMAMSVIAVMAIALAGEFEFIDHELAKRGVGASMGMLLLLLGNQLPKLVLPAAERRENPAPVLAAERFAARILVVTGLVAVLVWIWWPVDQMMSVAGGIVLAGFALAAANWARVLMTGGVLARNASGGLLRSAPRLTIFLLMHALFWVAVIFVADSIWGDAVSRWLVLPFIILNGGLAVLYTRRIKRQA